MLGHFDQVLKIKSVIGLVELRVEVFGVGKGDRRITVGRRKAVDDQRIYRDRADRGRKKRERARGVGPVGSKPALLVTEDHVVRRAADLDRAGQRRDHRLVLFVKRSDTPAHAIERAGHAGHFGHRDRGRRLSIVKQRISARPQRPVVVDPVVQHERLPIVLEVLEVGRLAQVTADGQGQLAVDGRYAGIVAPPVGLELALPGERRIAIDRPGKRRGDEAALVVAEVAEAVVLLIVGDHAIHGRAVVVDRAVAVDREALQAEAAQLHAAFLPPDGQRLLGDHVDGARRLARAVECRTGTFEDFHAIDVGEVPRREGRIEETVLAIIARGDDEAAEKEGVGPPIVVELDRAGNIAEQFVEAEHLLIVEHGLGHDRDRGRHVNLRNIDQRADGRGIGGVAPGGRALEHGAVEDRDGAGTARPDGCRRQGSGGQPLRPADELGLRRCGHALRPADDFGFRRRGQVNSAAAGSGFRGLHRACGQ